MSCSGNINRLEPFPSPQRTGVDMFVPTNFTVYKKVANMKTKKSSSGEERIRQRKAANERERRRMESINGGFNKLRMILPYEVTNHKLSKVETLKQAIEYIRDLSAILGESGRQIRHAFTEPQESMLQKLVIQSSTSSDSNILSISRSTDLDNFMSEDLSGDVSGKLKCSKEVWIPIACSLELCYL